MQAVHRVGVHDLADDVLEVRGHARDATATGSSLRRRPRCARRSRSARGAARPRATSAAVATDFGTIAQSGCFSSTCPRGSGWPKWAASSTLTQACTCEAPHAGARQQPAQRVELLAAAARAAGCAARATSGRTRRPRPRTWTKSAFSPALAASSTTLSTASGETSAVRTIQTPRSSPAAEAGHGGAGDRAAAAKASERLWRRRPITRNGSRQCLRGRQAEPPVPQRFALS